MISIEPASGTSLRLARAWLRLGIAALAGGGILAVLLVLSRTPGVGEALGLQRFFRAALIVHVDLTVLVWFMAFAGVIWSLCGDGRHGRLGYIAIGAASIGTLLLTVSPFLSGAQPSLNNYVPVLRHPLFYAGLALCAAGFALALWRMLATSLPHRFSLAPLRVGALLAAGAGAAALAAFVSAWLALPASDEQGYFEALFWGSGHLLQYQHGLLVALAWLWIADCLGARVIVSPHTLSLLFVLAALPLAASFQLVGLPAGTPDYVAGFASLMTSGHAAMVPLMLVALASIWQLRGVRHPAKSALVASWLLFAVGGVLGFLIRGANVTIPAHYHGAIVGVTLAFMGLAYVLLPQLGFRSAEGPMARMQPLVYGGGQLMHVAGLAWSGGYGVARKVVGADQVLTTLPQRLGMGLMGLGGLIAIVGGLMFVVVCLRAMRPRRQLSASVDASREEQQGQLQQRRVKTCHRVGAAGLMCQPPRPGDK